MSFLPAADLQAELAGGLGRVIGGEVRFDSYTRHLFSRDASMYAIEPIGVVVPVTRPTWPRRATAWWSRSPAATALVSTVTLRGNQPAETRSLIGVT
jgi:hypothetical protein